MSFKVRVPDISASSIFQILVLVSSLFLTTCGTNATVTPTTFQAATVTPTPFQDAPEHEIFTEQGCKLPCWQGIVPGKTTKEQFISIIKESPYFEPNTMGEYPRGRGSVIAWTYPNKPAAGGVAFLWDNIVKVIHLNATSRMTMEEIIKHLGEPTKVQTYSGLFGDHQNGYDVQTLYPDIGLVVRSEMILLPKNNRAAVKPDLVLDEVMLFPPGTTQDMAAVAKQFGPSTIITHVYLLPIQEWSGYGDYEIPRPN